MKIKEGFELRHVCGENVVVAHGERNIDFSKVINLNESAAEMWDAVIGKEFEIKDLAEALLAAYEVDEKTALDDAARVAKEWIEIGLIEAPDV